MLMQNKETKKSEWQRSEKLSLIAILTPFLFYLLNLVPQIKTLLVELAKKFDLPVSILNLLIVLILFVILTLYLYLRCVFKKNKQNTSSQIIEQNNTMREPEYTPPDDEVEILKLYRGGKKLFNKSLITISPFSTDKTNLCFDNLLTNNFITKYYETDVLDMVDNALGTFRYELSQKGRTFLSDNNLLD